MTTPSIKQALNRINSGHVKVLEAFAKAELVDAVGTAALGIRKCHSTLATWGAVEGGSITAFGRDLLAAYHTRRNQRLAA